MRRLATTLLRWLAERLIRLYYPRRTLQGAEHVPASGPALYVANHPNGLMDPLVLRVTIGRRVRFLAKSTLYGNPFGRLAMDAFDCLPVYRQQDMTVDEAGQTISRNEQTFARCRLELAHGAELALYPEGASHSDPQLKPLKSGAARIALSATAEASDAAGVPAPAVAPPLPVLVPVGLHYRDKAMFRSAVHLVVGKPIDVLEHVPEFRSQPRAAIDRLTAQIRARLDELVLQAETRDLLAGIARVASWTASAPDDDSPEERYRRTRALLQAYPRLQERDPQKLADVTRVAERYASTLQRLGVKDPWQFDPPRVSGGRLLGAMTRAALLLPAAVWGYATSFLPYRLAGYAARRATRDEDVLSTMKMIGGAAFLVGAWLIEAGVLTWWGGAWVGLGSLLLAPLAGYLALRFTETVGDVSEALRHLVWRTRRADTARELTERRRQLAAAVADALRDLSS
jgi:glycerol-3-phosphate O-acyltransferase / dihydroxyacetone phosphate acyltransferase